MMSRAWMILVVGSCLLAWGLAGCDEAKSVDQYSCEEVLKHYQKVFESANKKAKMPVKVQIEGCKEADNMEKHADTIKCLMKTDSFFALGMCDGTSAMMKDWAQASASSAQREAMKKARKQKMKMKKKKEKIFGDDSEDAGK